MLNINGDGINFYFCVILYTVCMKGSMKKYIIIVQGEGRGHLTQALAVEELLIKSGHHVSAVLVGKSSRRQVPAFFYQRIQSPVHHFESPNFWFDRRKRSVNIFLTLFYNLIRCRTFFKSVRWMHRIVQEHRPDIILNFYDLVAGLYSGWYRPSQPFICVGHHYWMGHPDFNFPRGYCINRCLLQVNNKITSWRAHRRLALSFFPVADSLPQKIEVVPPLLRQHLFKLKPVRENFVLVYLLNHGYAEDVIRWHQLNSELEIHCFWDKKNVEPVYSPHPGLTFHALNDALFLDLMSRCKIYVSTAGFESVCEAFYLAKPVILIPTSGHFEQKCNAWDAVRAGVGIYRTGFDFLIQDEVLALHESKHNSFVHWVAQSEKLFLEKITLI